MRWMYMVPELAFTYICVEGYYQTRVQIAERALLMGLAIRFGEDWEWPEDQDVEFARRLNHGPWDRSYRVRQLRRQIAEEEIENRQRYFTFLAPTLCDFELMDYIIDHDAWNNFIDRRIRRRIFETLREQL